VRWDSLFDDLEAQADALAVAERAAEAEERVRGELGRLEMWDRTRASVGAQVRVRLFGGGLVAGRLARTGPDWLLLEQDAGQESLVPTSAVLGLRGLSRYSAVPGSAGIVDSRLGIRQLLRGISRDRSAVRVLLVDGTVIDATIDRIGADFIEVAGHSAAQPRRHHEVRHAELVPISAIAAVSRSV
jgi:hypothetical protein